MSAPQHPLDSSVETSAKPLTSHAVSAERFTPGTLLAGRYRIVAPLGRGGMGEVYRAEDIRLGQTVALKFLPAALAADSERLERLVDEVRIGRQISHPNVCRLYDIAEAEGHHFLVMEYVDGEDLASLLRRIGRLPGDKALDIARSVCAGLAAAHDKGVIHRDLKPANVMIDGRGQARIADFGLAALAGGVSAADKSGTPAYMAPEQLNGEAASLRSDVYALGLVLHEMLTGKRVFEAKSVSELRALHAQSAPLSLSGSAKDIDPGLERVVFRCLARNSEERPASARVVLASLPGGDPLQAALIAGETPSPEMVAAASKVGDLSSSVAWACLLASLLGLLSIPILGARLMAFRQTPLPKPPDALVDRARDVLTRLGYPADSFDSAYGFAQDSAYLDHLNKLDPVLARRKLRSARPGPFLFYYRGSPRALASMSWIPTPPWTGPAELGRVLWNDPPLDVPGMTRVVLDPHGRLTGFAAVPPRFNREPGPGPDPDWSAALSEAGFNPASLRPSESSHWSAPVDSDRKAAWDGAMEGQPDIVFHVEAAAKWGRLVHFEMHGPWVKPLLVTTGGSTGFEVVTGIILAVSMIIFPAGLVLMRRNIRLGRGDRKGALRLAAFTFACLTLADLFRADHTLTPMIEIHLLAQIVSQGLYTALVVWLLYMALEPAVRRRWPHTLISWNRLLAGRFRDPLLGRDVLVGVLAGIVVVLDIGLDLPLVLMGRAPFVSVGTDLSSLSAPRHLAYFFLVYPMVGLCFSLMMLFLLFLFRALLRRAWLAHLMLFLFIMAPVFSGGDELFAAALEGSIFSATLVFVLVRFGLIASAMTWFTLFVLIRAPLTLELSAWYAGRSFAVLGFFAVLLVASAYLSLGGKPPFGKAVFDD